MWISKTDDQGLFDLMIWIMQSLSLIGLLTDTPFLKLRGERSSLLGMSLILNPKVMLCILTGISPSLGSPTLRLSNCFRMKSPFGVSSHRIPAGLSFFTMRLAG